MLATLMADGFLTSYTDLRTELSAHTGESVSRYGGENAVIREEIVRCLWFGGHFPQDELTTDCGKRLEVLNPGWWNVEGGPDFIRAEFLMENAGRLTGDVEVHTCAGAWWRHGHHRQPEYNNVALHVAMWNDAGERPVVKENGEQVPQLTLNDYIEEEMAELADIFDMEEERGGHAERFCTRALTEGDIPPQWLERFLEAAGDHRLQYKAGMFGQLLTDRPIERVLYRNISEALGYKNNRMPFIQLTRHLPLKTLREITPADATAEQRSKILEAVFLGTGAFLDAADTKALDGESAQYVSDLREIWDTFPKEIPGTQMTPAHWIITGTRPANHPVRRIAALAGLYATHLHEGLFGRIVRCMQSGCARGRRRADTVMRDELTSIFTGLRAPYWSYRYNFHSRPIEQPTALIGTQRAGAILTNVLLPLLLAYARKEDEEELENNVFMIWSRLPGSPPNRILKRMGHQLFPNEKGAGQSVRSFRKQQGMQQLYNDCCLTESGCRDCVLYHAWHA